MKKFRIIGFKYITAILVLLTLSAAFFIIGSKGNFSVRAENALNNTRVIPQSETEIFDLNSSAPKSAVVYDGGAAIIREDKTLWIFSDGEYKKYEGFSEAASDPGSIRRFGENYLILNNANKLYAINLQNVSAAPEQITYEGEIIACEYFGVNGKSLVTKTSSGTIAVYSLSNGFNIETDKRTELAGVVAKNLTPVCFGEGDKVFFVRNGDSKLCEWDPATDKLESIFKPEGEIKTITYVNGSVYYTADGKVWRYAESAAAPIELAINSDENYQLGKIVNPVDISCFGDDLIITDAGSDVRAVQRFVLSGDALDFSGYAIAKNRTAFNRVLTNVYEINRFGKTVYTLDDNKLTAIKNDENFNAYANESFDNYLVSEIGSPKTFAAGENSVLLVYTDAKAKLLTLSSGDEAGERVTLLNFSGSVKDTCYINGKFYVLTDDGSSSRVYVGTDGSTDFSEYCPAFAGHGVNLTVDGYGNAFIADSTSIYKNRERFAANDGIAKLSTDLFGNLYSIKGNEIRYYDETETVWKTVFTAQAQIKSFSMGIDDDAVYYILDGDERIYKMTEAKNAAINVLRTQNGYKTTATTVDEEFYRYIVDENANVYRAVYTKDTQTFTDRGVTKHESEYACLAKLGFAGVNGQKTFLALAGVNGVVIADETQAEKSNPEGETLLGENCKAYVTTSVNGYYVPVITPDCEYALSNGETVFRLYKGAVLTCEKKFSMLGTEYYLATFNYDGNAVKGYVPVSFTVEVLNENKEWRAYKLETVNKTKLYRTAELAEELLELSKNDEIRVFSIENGVAEVAYKTEAGFIIGYVDASAIINAPNLSVRNILLILAVTACLCGSVTFLLLRRKK